MNTIPITALHNVSADYNVKKCSNSYRITIKNTQILWFEIIIRKLLEIFIIL